MLHFRSKRAAISLCFSPLEGGIEETGICLLMQLTQRILTEHSWDDSALASHLKSLNKPITAMFFSFYAREGVNPAKTESMCLRSHDF